MLSNLNVDKFLADKPLAITLNGLEELRAHIMARLELFDSNPRAFVEMRAAERSQPSRGRPRSGATGIIQIRGAISQHSNTSESGDFASTEDISGLLRALLADDEIGSIVLDIDSPGGSTFGVAELAEEIRASRGKKPIVAVANSLAASAAYWIGAQADQFYVTPGGIVGSIGVYGIHQDVSKMAENEGVKTTIISAGKYKTAGNPFEPLGDDTRSRMQSRIDDVYDTFIRDVAKGRGVPDTTVREGYGEGDIVNAKQAKKLGMVDGIYTLEQAIAKAATIRPAQSGGPAASALFDESEPVSDDDTPEAPAEVVDEEAQARLQRMRLRSFQARAAAGAA